MTPSRRILIVTNGPLCRNPRVLKEATALGLAGHKVTVLTVRNHPASESEDLALLADAPFGREIVEMRPDAGIGAFFLRLQHRFGRELMQRLRCETPFALGPANRLLSRAQRHHADLTIVHNEVAHWLGTKLLDQGYNVAADIEDWHSEDLLPDARRARPMKLLRSNERKLLHRAVYVTTTSHALSEALYVRYGGRRAAVITNSFPLSPGPFASCSPAQIPSLVWFSQTVGPGRGLEAFLRAWSIAATPSHVTMIGEARNDYSANLRSLVPAPFRQRMTFFPLIPPRDLPRELSRHHVGLALELSTPPNKNLTISNKILQYLAVGLPIVATPTAGHNEVLSHAPAAGVAVDFGNAERAAAALDSLLGDPRGLALRRQAARQLAESHYSLEKEMSRLLAIVDRALSAASSSPR